MDEIVQEFLVESHENLDQLDRDLVALEQEPGSRELLSSIFRTIHTIKGTSGFLAFGRLEKLTHAGESLLARLRDGTQALDPVGADALLRMVDTVRSLLSAIETTGSEGEIDVDADIARVTACIQNGAAATPEPTTGAAEPAAPEPTTAAAEPAAPEAEPEAAPTATGQPPAPARQGEPEPAEPDMGGAEPQAAPAAAAPPPPPEPRSDAVAEETDPAVAAVAPEEPPAEGAAAAPARRSVADSSIRVDVELLDTLMRLVGELVLVRNQVIQSVGEASTTALTRTTQRLNLITTELQEGVMKTRMQPIEHVWSKLPRVVRDLASACGKQVRLEMVGRETELDRSLLEAVKDPLTHLVRNAIDHGVEAPEVRRAAGKNPEGTLTLRAYHEGGHVIVEIADDGGGINPDKVGKAAVDKGLISASELKSMDRREVMAMLFQPGFSTAEKITNVSGRGVGMDVVKTNIERIGGAVDVDSTIGVGTTWRLTIPLTLAIVQALTVECGGQRYAIPQVGVHELVFLDGQTGSAIEYVSGAPVYRLRGRLLPLVRLDEALGLSTANGERGGYVAVLQADGRRFGLVVDRVLNTEEIVVKPLTNRFKDIGVYAGATILGDGAVALILDVQSLARRSHLGSEAIDRNQGNDRADQHGGHGVERLLIAGVGERRVAIPLAMVARLEEFPLERIERVGSREVVQYRGEILPLLRLGYLLGAMPAEEASSVQVVVYTEGGRSVALAVDRIVDIIEDVIESRLDLEQDGLAGSAVIQQRVTELLDVRRAILAADPRFYANASASAFDDETMAVA